MSLKLYNETDIENIADSIRSKTGKSDTMKVSEMSDEIDSITGSGGVEIDTSLLLTSDKSRTTGAVTLTSEIGADNYEGSTEVNLYGSLQNAPIKFYKQLGSTQSPSTDTLLNTSLTNSSGVATYNATISETSNFYSVFDGISGKYPNCNSSSINVEYLNYVFYDPCTSDRTNEYTFLGIRSNGSSSLTYDSTEQCYIYSKTGGDGQGMMGITALKGLDDYKLTFKAKIINSSNSGILGFAYKDSSYYSIYYVLSTNTSERGNITENQGSDNILTNIGDTYANEWLTYETTVTNGQITFRILYNDTVLTTITRTPSTSITSNTYFGITNLWWASSQYYLKDIIVEAV